MESHGGRSLETPRGVPNEQRTVTPNPSNQFSAMPLDVRETGEDPIFRRIGSCGRGNTVPPVTPRRPDVPVRVHTRPQMAIVTAPPPQTCVLQPVTSSGPIRTTNLVRSSSRTTSGNLRRNISDFAPVNIATDNRNNISTISSTNGRLDNAIPSSPVLNGRTQFSNSLTNSASRRNGASVNSSVVDTVSLTLPRPEAERTSNEYVETPLRSGLSLIEPKLEPSPHRTIRTPNSGIIGGDSIQRDSNFAMVTLPVTGLERNSKHGERSSQRHHHGGEKKVITTQPSATFKKERVPSESACSRQNDDFIICSECKRCRCESCRTPRPLPSKWLCGTCHCSAETVVDYVSCLCCAKAVFYHCFSDETISYAEDPCSCNPDKFYTRFGCLGIMSLILPCLFCYWPCRGLVQLCESCHQYYSSKGCRCQKLHQQPAPLNFEKRLLDSPE